MTLQELQKQVLQLPISERWQLVQAVIISLQRETPSQFKRGNLYRLRGIASSGVTTGDADFTQDYTNYLNQKYQ